MVGIVARGAATTTCRPGGDEDALTLAVTAAQAALVDACFITPDQIGVAYLATLGEMLTPRPGANLLRQALDLNPGCHVADILAGARSGSEALFAVENLVKPSVVRYGLVVVADDPQTGPPGESAGAAAFVLGRHPEELLATFDFETGARVADTLRAAPQILAQAPPETRSVADGVLHLIREVMLRKRLKAADLRWLLIQEPYSGFRAAAAEVLGFTNKQVQAPGWANEIAATSISAPLIGLAATLDLLDPGERVLIASAAPGFGIDTYLFTATEGLARRRTGLSSAESAEDDHA